MKKIFTDSELERIKNAVKEAEKSTSAEIVPVFFESSGNYSDTYWKSGIVFASLWTFLYFVYYSLNSTWLGNLLFFVVTQMSAGLIGASLVYVFPFWKRMLLDRIEVRKRIQDIAYRVFLEEEIFKTKERTGMLLFMSFFEQEAIILGDAGINRVVKPSVWEGILSQLIFNLQKSDKTNAIVQAIQSMGNLLKEYPIQPNDSNELRDDLRLGDKK